MTPRKTKNLRMPAQPAEPLRVVNPDAAAIDVHSEVHWVCVPADRDPQPVQKFGAFTVNLEALADFLTRCRITTVVMESTGVYWIPLYELLERRGFQVLLIDPRKARRLEGRPKSDRLDCQWLQRLHAYGLLAGAFRPPDQIVELRSYIRQRQLLLTYAATHIQHMQKSLEQMNLKLTEVVSDITGATGQRIIRAILDGARDAVVLAKLRDCRCKNDEDTIAKALQGNWRDDHLFTLQQAVELYDFYHRQIDVCEKKIEGFLGTFTDRSGGKPMPKKAGRCRTANAPGFDVRTLLYRLSGVDLTVIEGIEGTTALIILSEIGYDLSRFPSVKHFTSWLGLCPNRRVSAGKVKSSHVRPGANRVTTALRLAARSLHSSKSALGAFLRRLKARMGKAQAITATAHKLARLVYAVLKNGTEYVRQGLEDYESKYRERLIRNVERKARELGFGLVPATAPA